MTTKKVHFVGIKGVGMTSLACSYKEAGWEVMGSDTEEVFITDEILREQNIKVVSPVNSPIEDDVDLVICSTAYQAPQTTPRTLTLAEALAEFVKERKVIAVAGVGGKTTTSAMLSTLFRSASRQVGYYVGTSTISTLNAPGSLGTDDYFVVEADEYAVGKNDKRAKMNLLSPTILITTNIVHDHPDIYPDEQSTMDAFGELLTHIKKGGVWICNHQDPLTSQLLSTHKDVLKDIKIVQYGSDHPLYSRLDLSVFGDQNKLDALAAVLAAIEAGLPEDQALESIKAYRGAGRRQEFHGEAKGRLLYDDYGHHPGEIEITVNAFKEHFPNRRILLIFESHTYSRTESLLKEFAQALTTADLCFVMPIFESAREKGKEHQVSAELLASKARELGSRATAVTWDNAAQKVVDQSESGDVILTMGAGFVYKLHPQIIALFNK